MTRLDHNGGRDFIAISTTPVASPLVTPPLLIQTNKVPYPSVMNLDAPQKIVGRYKSDTEMFGRVTKFVSHPNIAASLAVIRSSPSGPNTLIDNQRLLLYALAIAYGEARFDIDAVSSGTTTYRGRKVRFYNTGPWQFNQGTYRDSLAAATRSSAGRWAFLSAINTGLKARGFVDTYFKPGLDASLPMAVYGRFAGIRSVIDRDWTFVPHSGYQFIGSSAVDTPRHLEALPGMQSKLEGGMILTSFYHINGLGASQVPWRDIKHKDRLRDDVRALHSILEAPRIREVIDQLLNVTVPEAMAVGDPSDIKTHNLTTGLAFGLNAHTKNLLRNPPSPTITSHFKHGRLNPDTGQKRDHKGVDLRAAIGTPVYSPVEGVVVATSYHGPAPNWGQTIVVAAKSGVLRFRYAHLSKVLVRNGQTVMIGEVIGLSGKSGTKTPHLHAETLTLQDGKWVQFDPLTLGGTIIASLINPYNPVLSYADTA